MRFFGRQKKLPISGEIIKDYGIVNQHRKGIAKFKHSVLLVEHFGKKKIIIKEDTTLIGGEVRTFELDKDGAMRLKETLDNALRLM